MASRFVQTSIFLCVMCPAIAALQGCSTPPVQQKQLSPTERVKYDNAVGVELARQFETQIKIKHNPEVSVYLRQLAQTLADAVPETKGSAVGVITIQDRADGQWRDYGLPGNRIYLSVGLLRTIEFENALAAAIALELAHVRFRLVQERLQASPQGASFGLEGMNGLLLPQPGDFPKVEYFGPGGVFAFPEQGEMASIDFAVDMLYRAGFDCRGMVSLFQTYQEHPEHSPFDESSLPKFLDQARRAVAQYSPLRNPVVRSQAFVAIQKRMQRL